MFTGKNPEILDHINMNRADDRFENLREISRSANNLNSIAVRGETPFRGVLFHKPTGKYLEHIKLNYKNEHIGLFTTAEEASKAYEERKIEYAKLLGI